MLPSLAPWRVSRPLPIIAGESVDGYVARVAAAHYFPNMAEITALGGAIYSFRSHASFCAQEDMPVIADCLCVDPEVLRHHSPQWQSGAQSLNFFGAPIGRIFMEFSSRRFSPASLKASAHHRALWQIRLFPFCDESWEFLQDKCPNPACGKKQAWHHTQGIDLCDICAEPLARAPTMLVPEDIREPLRKLVGLIHPDPARREEARAELPSLLSDLGGGDVLALASELAVVIDPRVARPMGMTKNELPTEPERFVAALAATWPLLCDWPRGLEALICDRINQNSKNRGDGNRGASYRLLLPDRGKRLPPKAREHLARFVSECRTAKSRGLSGTEAMQICGFGMKALVAMRRSGEIPSIAALSGNRLHALFDKAAIYDLAASQRARTRLTTVATALGIPTYAVHELAALGLLDEAPRRTGLSGKLQIFADSLDDLQRLLVEKLPEIEKDFGVPIARLMLTANGAPKPWGSVLAAICDGSLAAGVQPGPGAIVPRIVIEQEAWDAFAGKQPSDLVDWSSIRIPKSDVAEMMGVSKMRFAQYSEFLIGPGHYTKTTPMPDAMGLCARYISNAEITARLNVHPLTTIRLVKKYRVKAALHSLFERASAEELIPGLFSSGREAAFAQPAATRLLPTSVLAGSMAL